MKKNRLLILATACLLANLDLIAQNISFTGMNNIRARVVANGSLFHNNNFIEADFQVPSNSQIHAIYFASLCMSGTNNGVNLASGSYSNSDFTYGPLTTSSASTTNNSITQYNRIWTITRSQINTHIANFNSASYSAPVSISTWPAHGDTTAGFDYYLAPFEDVNSNGTYEPLLGDYPKIKGDEAHFFIYNDATLHSQTGGTSMGLEIHCMVYSFSTTNALNETVFTDYKVINRSTNNYSNFRIGKFIDFDLGNYNDDFIETDVDRSMVFVKNGDNFDENTGRFYGYGSLHASVGMITLKGPKVDDDSQDNSCSVRPRSNGYQPNGTGFGDGVVDNERFGMTSCISINHNSSTVGGGDFTTDLDLYNFMRSVWRDGRPQTFGGTGYQTSGGIRSIIPYFFNTDATLFSTNGASSNAMWSENSNSALPGDRKVIVSSGSFNFSSNEVQEMTYAYVFGRATVNNNVASSVASLKLNADFVTNFFRASSQLTQCMPSTVGISTNNLKANELILFPNPTKGTVSFNTEFSGSYRIINLTGASVQKGQFSAGVNKLNLATELKGGIYFLQLNGDTGNTFSKKIIISRN
jgi:hypothetical protein